MSNPSAPSAAASAHWEAVYSTKQDSELSWFQSAPSRSLAIIREILPRPLRIVDAGGGQSSLAAEVLQVRGFEEAEVTVVDLSPSAIARAKTRSGAVAGRIRWIVGDAIEADGVGAVDLWHDRALFHFMADSVDRARYAARIARAVVPRGHLVIGAFAPDGPERCSGLPVMRHDGASIAAAFAADFELVHATREEHLTPWGKPQRFGWALLRRKS